jgi:hypothetical protein
MLPGSLGARGGWTGGGPASQSVSRTWAGGSGGCAGPCGLHDNGAPDAAVAKNPVMLLPHEERMVLERHLSGVSRRSQPIATKGHT